MARGMMNRLDEVDASVAKWSENTVTTTVSIFATIFSFAAYWGLDPAICTGGVADFLTNGRWLYLGMCFYIFLVAVFQNVTKKESLVLKWISTMLHAAILIGFIGVWVLSIRALKDREHCHYTFGVIIVWISAVSPFLLLGGGFCYLLSFIFLGIAYLYQKATLKNAQQKEAHYSNV